jgi:hypothetical protein
VPSFRSGSAFAVIADKPAGCSKSSSSAAAADESTGGVASGYVEDAFEARTKLANFFSILPTACQFSEVIESDTSFGSKSVTFAWCVGSG